MFKEVEGEISLASWNKESVDRVRNMLVLAERMLDEEVKFVGHYLDENNKVFRVDIVVDSVFLIRTKIDNDMDIFKEGMNGLDFISITPEDDFCIKIRLQVRNR